MLNSIITALHKPVNSLATGFGGISLSAMGLHIAKMNWVDWLGVIGILLGALASSLVIAVQITILLDRKNK